MKAIGAPERTSPLRGDHEKSIIHFKEGLIGFSECKHFILMEVDDLAPLRLLQCTEQAEIAFLLLDPSVVVKNYHDRIPAGEWDSLGLEDRTAQLAFVICSFGRTPPESTGNFLAPLVINRQTMAGRQIILAEGEFSVRHPLV